MCWAGMKPAANPPTIKSKYSEALLYKAKEKSIIKIMAVMLTARACRLAAESASEAGERGENHPSVYKSLDDELRLRRPGRRKQNKEREMAYPLFSKLHYLHSMKIIPQRNSPKRPVYVEATGAVV